MKTAKLTAVRHGAMRPTDSERVSMAGAIRGRLAVAACVPLALSGCINVTAPTEPIVIELNINIRQEVIYRLAEDAGNTIEDNADIF